MPAECHQGSEDMAKRIVCSGCRVQKYDKKQRWSDIILPNTFYLSLKFACSEQRLSFEVIAGADTVHPMNEPHPHEQ